MKAEGRECIWSGQCGEGCQENCPDYTPADDSQDNEDYYFGILRENAEVYQRVADTFSDGRTMKSES